ncbi:MAG: hypothetical protein GY946_30480, partial [bacterium]|nr:hypothetical protein [bacterium]
MAAGVHSTSIAQEGSLAIERIWSQLSTPLFELGEQPWTRDLLLLVVVTFGSWPLGWISVRLIRRWRAKLSHESRLLRVSLDLLEACLWPLWALLLLTTGFTIWVNTSGGVAGDPFRV